MKKVTSYLPINLDFGLLLLRVVFGGIMLIEHGYPKMIKLMSGGEIQFYNFLGLGNSASLGLTVFAEVICAFFILLGLFHRLATIPLIITFAVAFFMVHAEDSFGDKEAAFIYLFSYTILFFTGSGKFSLDYLIGKK